MQQAAGELIFLEVSVIKSCAERKTIKASCRRETLLVIFFHEREQKKKTEIKSIFKYMDLPLTVENSRWKIAIISKNNNFFLSG